MVKVTKKQQLTKRKAQKSRRAPPKIRRVPMQRMNALQPVLRLSQCVQTFIKAVKNPFNTTGVCLPAGDALPSQKYIVRVKGNAFVGTNGIGIVACVPTPTNDRPCVYFTNALFTSGSGSPIPPTGTTGVNAIACLEGPTNATILAGSTAPVVWKYVLSALRVRYVGTENNKGGTITLWHDDEDGTVVGMTPVDVKSKFSARNYPVSRNWQTIVDSSGDTRLANYTVLPDTESIRQGVALSTIRFPMVAVLTGLAGNEFEYEFIHHFEYRDQNRTSANTPTNVDPIGGPAAINAAIGDPSGSQSGIYEAVVNAIGQTSQYAPDAMHAAKATYGIYQRVRDGWSQRPTTGPSMYDRPSILSSGDYY